MITEAQVQNRKPSAAHCQQRHQNLLQMPLNIWNRLLYYFHYSVESIPKAKLPLHIYFTRKTAVHSQQLLLQQLELYTYIAHCHRHQQYQCTSCLHCWRVIKPQCCVGSRLEVPAAGPSNCSIRHWWQCAKPIDCLTNSMGMWHVLPQDHGGVLMCSNMLTINYNQHS